MESFIVLGILPGTQYQISFLAWAYATLSTAAVILLIRLAPNRQTIQTFFIAHKVARFIDRYQLQA